MADVAERMKPVCNAVIIRDRDFKKTDAADVAERMKPVYNAVIILVWDAKKQMRQMLHKE